MARIIFATLGSDGDVVPFFRWGERLRRRGHEPCLVSHERYVRAAAALGWPGVAVTTETEWRAHLEDVMGLDENPSVFLRKYFVTWNQRVFAAIKQLLASDTIIVGQQSLKLSADVVAAACFDVSSVRIALAPRVVRRPARVMDRGAYMALVKEFEQSVGVLRRDPLRVPCLGLWDDWLQSDARLGGVDAVTGSPRGSPYTCLDQTAALEWPDGDGPVVTFVAGTLGTTANWAGQFFEAAVEAGRKLGRRCILLGGARTDVPAGLPAWARWSAYSRLDAVLERSDVIVHHGGVGTITEAVAHAVPQVVIPRVFGQHWLAERVEQLGVGLTVPADQLTPALAPAISAAATGSQIRVSCQDLQRIHLESDRTETLCDVLVGRLRGEHGGR